MCLQKIESIVMNYINNAASHNLQAVEKSLFRCEDVISLGEMDGGWFLKQMTSSA